MVSPPVLPRAPRNSKRTYDLPVTHLKLEPALPLRPASISIRAVVQVVREAVRVSKVCELLDLSQNSSARV